MTAAPYTRKRKFDSSTPEKINIRLPIGMRAASAARAEQDCDSLNTLVVKALDTYLFTQVRQSILIASLESTLVLTGSELPVFEWFGFDKSKRSADTLAARLPKGMRAAVEARSDAEGRSMNRTVVMALESYLFEKASIDSLLRALEERAAEVKAESAGVTHEN